MLFLLPIFLCFKLVFINHASIIDQNYDQCDGDDLLGCELKYANVNIPNNSIKPTPQQLCELCDIALPVVRRLIDQNKTEHFQSIAIFFCNEFKIVDPVVCSLVIKEYEFAILNVIKDTSLTTDELCDIGLNCGPVNNNILNWNITLPNVPKPPIKPPVPPQPDAPKLRILHFSDLHIDFEYQPGAPADCLDPLCCRNQSTPNPNSTEPGAGYWGDYRNCDVPLWTVENMFQYISKNEEFDFVYWTGDLPPHNVWNQTKTDQLRAYDTLSKLFIKYFPEKVIYPTLGNHEAAPCNLYPTPYIKEDSIEWLYSAVAKNWTATGLPSDLIPNITNGAFYTVQVRPGLRLISLNTNYCPSGNFWLYVNSTDQLGQLDWLANLLQHSEDIGEKVHIIGHIASRSCLPSWSYNYFRIINRYESTVAGQMFGHSHSDGFSIYYDELNLTRAVSVAYVGPSTTTYSYLNPGYRIYTVDGVYANSTFQVIDHETRFLNITDANLSGNPKWLNEYSAKKAFGFTTLYPQDWNDLIDRALKDLDGPLFNLLYRFYYKSSDAIDPNCDKRCKIDFLCDFKRARSDFSIPCGA